MARRTKGKGSKQVPIQVPPMRGSVTGIHGDNVYNIIRVKPVLPIIGKVPQVEIRIEPETLVGIKQRQIYSLLFGRAMTLKQLASALDCDWSRLQKDHLKEMMERGEIKNDSKEVGYYRPDAPPME